VYWVVRALGKTVGIGEAPMWVDMLAIVVMVAEGNNGSVDGSAILSSFLQIPNPPKSLVPANVRRRKRPVLFAARAARKE
jgi:hypothetical protein